MDDIREHVDLCYTEPKDTHTKLNTAFAGAEGSDHTEARMSFLEPRGTTWLYNSSHSLTCTCKICTFCCMQSLSQQKKNTGNEKTPGQTLHSVFFQRVGTRDEVGRQGSVVIKGQHPRPLRCWDYWQIVLVAIFYCCFPRRCHRGKTG